MEQYPLPEHIAELDFGTLTREQFFTAIINAGRELGWHLISVNGDMVIFHASDPNPAFGETVSIAIHEENAVLTSRSVNEYYLNAKQNELNAALFTEALGKIASRVTAEERNRHPHTREKYGALIPSKTYMVTPILMYLNILIFFLIRLYS